MAINKIKNVTLQITFPKEDAEHLDVLKKALNENGFKVSKSDILLTAFRDYLNILLLNADHKKEQNEARGGQENA